jgi:hypothetical protein
MVAIGALVGCSAETRGRILWGAPEGGGELASEGGAGVVLLSGQTTPEYGGDGGNPHTDTCPPGQAVIGYQGELLPADAGLIVTVSRIQTLCGVLAVDGTASNEIVVTPGATLPEYGMWPGPSWTQTCGTNEVVVGFSGRSDAYIYQIDFQCGHWIVSSTNGIYRLSMDRTTTLGGAGSDAGNQFPEVACPVGQMAVGTALRSGFWLDAFSLVCGTPTLQWDAGP